MEKPVSKISPERSLFLWKEERTRTQQDPEFTDQQKKNLDGYFEIQIRLAEYEVQKKARQKARARAIDLVKRHKRLTAQIQAVAQEFNKIFYFDGENRAFSYGDRRAFRAKYLEGHEL